MDLGYTVESLTQFEEEVATMFNNGEIKSPVHMSGSIDGKEEEFLIELFKKVKKEDFVFSTYRSHHHALLKGIDKVWLLNWIKNNKSIHVMSKEHKFLTSAIVGGMLSIALGAALSIKLQGPQTKPFELPDKDKLATSRLDYDTRDKTEDTHVWCFIGDMTATTGQFWECWNYAKNFDLPITFVIADNGLSTDTDTKVSWGMDKDKEHWYEYPSMINKKIIYYKYTRKWPHYGTGKFVSKLWDDMEDVKAKGF